MEFSKWLTESQYNVEKAAIWINTKISGFCILQKEFMNWKHVAWSQFPTLGGGRESLSEAITPIAVFSGKGVLRKGLDLSAT